MALHSMPCTTTHTVAWQGGTLSTLEKVNCSEGRGGAAKDQLDKSKDEKLACDHFQYALKNESKKEYKHGIFI